MLLGSHAEYLGPHGMWFVQGWYGMGQHGMRQRDVGSLSGLGGGEVVLWSVREGLASARGRRMSCSWLRCWFDGLEVSRVVRVGGLLLLVLQERSVWVVVEVVLAPLCCWDRFVAFVYHRLGLGCIDHPLEISQSLVPVQFL